MIYRTRIYTKNIFLLLRTEQLYNKYISPYPDSPFVKEWFDCVLFVHFNSSAPPLLWSLIWLRGATSNKIISPLLRFKSMPNEPAELSRTAAEHFVFSQYIHKIFSCKFNVRTLPVSLLGIRVCLDPANRYQHLMVTKNLKNVPQIISSTSTLLNSESFFQLCCSLT